MYCCTRGKPGWLVLACYVRNMKWQWESLRKNVASSKKIVHLSLMHSSRTLVCEESCKLSSIMHSVDCFRFGLSGSGDCSYWQSFHNKSAYYVLLIWKFLTYLETEMRTAWTSVWVRFVKAYGFKKWWWNHHFTSNMVLGILCWSDIHMIIWWSVMKQLEVWSLWTRWRSRNLIFIPNFIQKSMSGQSSAMTKSVQVVPTTREGCLSIVKQKFEKGFSMSCSWPGSKKYVLIRFRGKWANA